MFIRLKTTKGLDTRINVDHIVDYQGGKRFVGTQEDDDGNMVNIDEDITIITLNSSRGHETIQTYRTAKEIDKMVGTWINIVTMETE